MLYAQVHFKSFTQTSVVTCRELLVCRVGPDLKYAPSDTSYLAMTTRFAITPGTTFAYDAYITTGRLDQIRGAFARVKAMRDAEALAAVAQSGATTKPIVAPAPPRPQLIVEPPLTPSMVDPKFLVAASN
jgi:hypothetical protein